APPAAPEQNAEPKVEAKAEPVLKPRLAKTLDLELKANRLIWSPDGKWFVAEVGAPDSRERINFVSQTSPARGDMVLMEGHRLIGITPDSKSIITDLRESGLLSGLHAVRLFHVMSDRGGGGPIPMGGGPPLGPGGYGVRFEQSKEHVLDPDCERQYGFP